MKIALPRKRTFQTFHRWLGILSALFLVIVSATGLLLNHSTWLGLDRIFIKSSFIVSKYGMVGIDAVRSYDTQSNEILSYIDGSLFINTTQVASGAIPLAYLQSEPLNVIATREELIYLSPQNELVERLPFSQTPWSELIEVGLTESSQPLFVTDAGTFTPDSNWIGFESYNGDWAKVGLTPAKQNRKFKESILTEFQGQGIPLYRVLLDLHSGRLFGWGGRTLMDLTAIAVLILVSSGFAAWLRNSRYRSIKLK